MPMLHDDTFLGWLTTGAYFAAAMLSGVAAHTCTAGRRAFDTDSRRLACFWGLVSAGLALLAINKQLDFQSVLTDALRTNARRGGWYENRRVLQAAFIAAALAMAAGGLWVMMRLLGRRWREHLLLLIGLAVLFTYLLLRVADIERLQEMTGASFAAERLRGGMEWLSLVAIGFAAWRRAVRG